MTLDDLLNKRRSYRSLKKVNISKETVKKLSHAASLAPSCYNKQPWRFVFVTDDAALKPSFEALNVGNEWAKEASGIVAVVAKKDDDCILPDGREYYKFDIGMAVGLMLLKATELGLVAHPIAGYNPDKIKELLKIPAEYEVVVLIILGEKDEKIKPYFKDFQVEAENNRPVRLDIKDFAFTNYFGK